MGWKIHRGSIGGQNSTSVCCWSMRCGMGILNLGSNNESPEAANVSLFVVCGLIVKHILLYFSNMLQCLTSWWSGAPPLFPPVSTATLLQTGSAFISHMHEPSVLSEGHQAASRHPNKHQEDPRWTEPITLMKSPLHHQPSTPSHGHLLMVFKWSSEFN